MIPPPPSPVRYSPDLDAFDKEAAIWIHGGYPQYSHTTAENILMQKCVAAGFEWIGAAAIWILERNLNNEIERTSHTA